VTATGPWGAMRPQTDFARRVMAASPSPISVFDPVLCELVYRWYCPPGGLVFDPFAGGSVRGIVASLLGRQYIGIDVRAEQIEANAIQWDRIKSTPHAGSVLGSTPIEHPAPVWHCGDSRKLAQIVPGIEADLIFSCPPYSDLERYGDDPRDLSTMNWDEFLGAYTQIITTSCALLKPDRFACFVIGDVRDRRTGFLRGLPARTIAAFESAGLGFYNDAVLIPPVGSLPLRAVRPFETARKLGRAHQNVVIFVKGDPKRATEAIGDVETGDPYDDGEPSASPAGSATPVEE